MPPDPLAEVYKLTPTFNAATMAKINLETQAGWFIFADIKLLIAT